MGTKNNPGAFDCYANAEPDEPMFVLLGRDKHAPALVEAWASNRERDGEDPGKVLEARVCAQHMRLFRARRSLAERTKAAESLAVRCGCSPVDAVLTLAVTGDSPEKAQRLLAFAAESGRSVESLALFLASVS